MKKGTWKDYFSFSKKERVAILILLIIIVVFVVLPYLYAPVFKKPVVDEKLEQQLTAQKSPENFNKFSGDNSADVNNTADNNNPAAQTTVRELFYFDPNTLDAAGWKRLGLRDKTINTIQNYCSKGGHFRVPDDIRKIYGLKKEEADALVPFVNSITREPEKRTTKYSCLYQ